MFCFRGLDWLALLNHFKKTPKGKIIIEHYWSGLQDFKSDKILFKGYFKPHKSIQDFFMKSHISGFSGRVERTETIGTRCPNFEGKILKYSGRDPRTANWTEIEWSGSVRNLKFLLWSVWIWSASHGLLIRFSRTDQFWSLGSRPESREDRIRKAKPKLVLSSRPLSPYKL